MKIRKSVAPTKEMAYADMEMYEVYVAFFHPKGRDEKAYIIMRGANNTLYKAVSCNHADGNAVAYVNVKPFTAKHPMRKATYADKVAMLPQNK